MFKAKEKIQNIKNNIVLEQEITYSELEHNFVWARLAISLRKGDKESFLNDLEKFNFIPIVTTSKGSQDDCNLMFLAAKLNRVEEFMALVEVGAKNSKLKLKDYLKRSLPIDRDSSYANRFSSLRDILNYTSEPSPVLSCLATDNVDCLAELLDHPVFGKALLEAEPKVLSDDQKQLNVMFNGIESSLLYQANNCFAGNCLSLLFLVKEFSEIQMKERFGLYEEHLVRNDYKYYKTEEKVEFSMFEAILNKMLQINNVSFQEKEKMVKKYVQALHVLVDSHKNLKDVLQVGSYMSFADLINEKLLPDFYVMNKCGEEIYNLLKKCIVNHKMNYDVGIEVLAMIKDKEFASDFLKTVIDCNLKEPIEKRKFKI